MSDVIRLVDVRDEPLDLTEVFETVGDDVAGAVAMFVGTVRDHDGGRGVDALSYSSHPSVFDAMNAVASSVAEECAVTALAVVHRIGALEVGDVAVVAAASAPHRPEAFAACRELIERLKAQVPIWKLQLFDDGSEEWVGTP
ncbi:molybdopterin synthase catalytic subunit [Mumia flava]|uniref:Molybdopterin synthase catalytic subunit 1 n=1 Tax=Mumia flava TaxID=1348852 RepID=A0A0B2B0M1_9ACTN|nr:molybdenum cofactor biosynthesis protein MoaE [Mumia flava]PJJ56633.1 molybdopterin synthase catalytic subunit [Mumia flava]